MTNKEFTTITFWWKDRIGEGECSLHNTTYSQALMIAKKFGYREHKWYDPRTWSNRVVTVG